MAKYTQLLAEAQRARASALGAEVADAKEANELFERRSLVQTRLRRKATALNVMHAAIPDDWIVKVRALDLLSEPSSHEFEIIGEALKKSKTTSNYTSSVLSSGKVVGTAVRSRCSRTQT